MTSGEFASFPVDRVWVNRDERQRRELKDIPELASSIRRLGVIHPPVIQRDGQLRVGERRWTAIKLLGWTHMPVQFIEDLDESELRLVELEENLKRSSLEWQEECLAILDYHTRRSLDNAEWTAIMTAEVLGMNERVVQDKLVVAREILGGNKRVTEAPKYSVAKNVTIRVNERRAATATMDAIKAAKPAAIAAQEEAAPAPVKTVPLLNEDFHDWSSSYTGQPFNFLHCDFPYGVGADKHDQGQAAAQGGYADSPDVYWQLVSTLADSMDNVVAPSAHLMFWFSMDYYQSTLEALTDMGWTVNPFPLVWFKNDNTGILPDPQRGPRRVYETAFFASRGDRKLTGNGAVANTVAWPGQDKSIHMSEKPVGMLKHFMRMIVDEYSFVLDPTAGSANAIRAAHKLGAGRVLGLERDTEFYNRAKEAFYNE